MAATLDRPLLEIPHREYTEEERTEFYRRLAETQEKLQKLIPPGVSLVDELIAERRAEAKREDEWNSAS